MVLRDYSLPDLINVISKALEHLYGRAAEEVKVVQSEKQNTFVLTVEFKSSERRAFHVVNADEFQAYLKSTAEQLYASNTGYKDSVYILGVAVEQVLEKHYRMHHNEGLAKL